MSKLPVFHFFNFFNLISISILLSLCTVAKGGMDELTFKNWIKGDLDEAFALAKKKNAPVLMYWGAVWCPPCNELKKNVFSKPEFKDSTSGMVKLFIDGDQENAQEISDLFDVTGYPTILLLNKNRKELMRIAESISIHEFTDVMKDALKSSNSIRNLLSKAHKNESLSVSELRLLAMSRISKIVEKDWSNNKLELSKLLFDLSQSQSIQSDTKIATRITTLGIEVFLSASSHKYSDQRRKLLQENLSAQTLASIGQFASSRERTLAARDLILWESKNILKWAKKSLNDNQFTSITNILIAMGETIGKSEEQSVDTRLWAIYPKMNVEAFLTAKKNEKDKEFLAISESTKNQVRSLVLWADRNSRTEYERQAVIAGAASLLSKIGDTSDAISLLERESKTSKSPWYYLSYQAILHKRDGNFQKAIEKSAAASDAAKGRATKIQWLSSEFLLLNDIKLKTAAEKSPRVLEKIYQHAFSLKDGFKGRNKYRMKRIKKVMGSPNTPNSLKVVYQKYSRVCKESVPKKKLACSPHFQLEKLSQNG